MTRWTTSLAPFGIAVGLVVMVATIGLAVTPAAHACGGLFCQTVPVDQAGEQIIFRQDGDQITCVVLIQYSGSAEQFAWVLPIPGIPDVRVGSELVFPPLELATRPQFTLEVRGSECPRPASLGFPIFGVGAGGGGGRGNANSSAEDGVTVLSQAAVGPYDSSVVSSTDPEALATWLTDNGYNLGPGALDMIAPYVNEGQNFVAIKLQKDRTVGDIQPCLIRYTNPRPVIPIRLTAVATQPDMGVLVWLLGEARAVPVNYLHVDVNYTRLNWYAGSTNAYAAYQDLVTEAMNEAGGRGFATDYAGTDIDLLDRVPAAGPYRTELEDLAAQTLDMGFYDTLLGGAVFGADKVSELLSRYLSLAAGSTPFAANYSQLVALAGAAALQTARQPILAALENEVVIPLEDTLAVLDGMPYVTRLYTTLSADEMTLDPEFVFNPDMPTQPLGREATLTIGCRNDQTTWQLELGPGTGREGEGVIQGYGSPPTSAGAAPTLVQPAMARSARTRDSGAPEPVTVNTFELARIGSPRRQSNLCGLGLVGVIPIGLALLAMVRLSHQRRRAGAATNPARERRPSQPSSHLPACLLALATLLSGAQGALACGGFFCQAIPIQQAGEQIIFRQDGDQVTCVVFIQYSGAAEDFSWVIPIPGIPDVGVGSDLVFPILEGATRPQFNLTFEGSECPQPAPSPSAGGGADSDAAANSNSAAPEDDGVTVLAQYAVGPYDTTVVGSDDPDALAAWLEDNGYSLGENGRDMIAPYVEEGQNFVAVKLQNNRSVGDIQPCLIKYTSARPIIPIRLTAVATQPDLGVLVWLLGDARAVPVNYLHVDVNYTRLNWYTGTFGAYASYQGLVTAAMNEAGGQGFATDYAGRDIDVTGLLPSVSQYRNELTRLASLSVLEFYEQIYFSQFFAQGDVLDILRRRLPLPEGQDEFAYATPEVLQDILGAAQLEAARPMIAADIETDVVVTLEDTLAVFEGKPYLTRLYSTLSADEMTLDPEFVFNPDLADQPLTREATLRSGCVDGQTHWQLELGPGTDRPGQVVIEGTGPLPGFFAPPPTIDQAALSRSARTMASGPAEDVTVNNFGIATVNGTELVTGGGGSGGRQPRRSVCGAGSNILSFAVFPLACFAIARGGRGHLRRS